MKNKKIKNKAGRYTPLLAVLLIVGMLWAIGSSIYIPDKANTASLLDNVLSDNEVKIEEWEKIAEIYSWQLGEYDPGAGNSGWLSTFCLDYGQVPGTVLANNATDWSTDPNSRGYVDADAQTIDLAANDPFYFVVRCRFNTDAKNGSTWEHDRFRVNLTVSGSETISGVGEYDNSTTDGDAVVSDVSDDWIFINFFWDDGSDGYRIVSDGTINWSISIYEKR